MVKLEERAASPYPTNVLFSLEISEYLAANSPQLECVFLDMRQTLAELQLCMVQLLGCVWWWDFQRDLISERLDLVPEGPDLESLFPSDLTPTKVLEIMKRDMPANNAQLRALQKIQLCPECWRTVELYLDDLWSEDYALEDYIEDYVRSADLEEVVERFSQVEVYSWVAVDEERKRGLLQTVKVMKEIRERGPELSGWRYRGWRCDIE